MRIGFYFEAHGFSNDWGYNTDVGPGWYIDQVEILSGPLPQWSANGIETFEDAAAPDRWVAENGVWEIGVPTSGPPANTQDNRAHEGNNVLATILSGNYTDDRSGRIVGPAFTVATADQNPRLRFWHWWSIGGHDFGTVQITADNGATWKDLSPRYVNDSSGQWTRATLDLSAYAGQSVRIGFYFEAHGFSNDWGYHIDVGPGWYIDDVMIEIDPDTITPNTSITSGPADSACVTSPSVTFNWTGSDNYPGALAYSFKMDGDAWYSYALSTTTTFNNLSQGTHTFSVTAKDQAGNEDPTPALRTFTVDSLPPVISVIQPAPALDSAIVTWTTNEPSSSQIEYGTSVAYGFETTPQPSLVTNHGVTLSGLNQNTTYHYRIKSIDSCGNQAVSSDLTVTTLSDVTPPNTSFTTGPTNNGKACSSTATICWTGADDFTTASGLLYSYSLDTAAWSNWTTDVCHSFAGLSEGPHSAQVKAKDGSGNISANPATLSFSVDSIAPLLSDITAVPRDYTPIITWNTNEPASTRIEYGETTAYGISSPLDTAMTGTHAATLAALTPKTTYHYRVTSNDGCSETVSNDMIFTTTDILYPNLKVKQIEMPATFKALDQVTIKWLVGNDGPGSAQGTWTDKIFLSTDPTIDSQDVLLGEFTFSDGLDWGAERWRAATLTMPAVPAGTYYIIAQTDAGNGIVETTKNDNSLTKRIDYLKVKQLSAAPDRISVQLAPGQVVNGTIDLSNLGGAPLSGITAAVQGNSPNVSIQATSPSTMNGRTTQKVNYSVTASDDSVKTNSPVLTFAAAEGQTASITFNITVNPATPNLVANPGYLEKTMVRGAQTFVEFEVTNTGSAPVSNLKIVLPTTGWLSLITPAGISSLGSGEKIKVGLSLKPAADLALGPYTGNLALNADNASATVGFRFTAVSGKIGGLKITAKDEYTYFADDHPPVTGASVKISNPYDGTVIAEGLTDTSGRFLKESLPEGFYKLEVRADQHGAYNAVVQVDPGILREITAFLPRQLVTYTWKVVPVQTDDKYAVTLEATFETHVPAPVITVEPMVLDLRNVNFDTDGLATVIYKVTNHGLIAAQSATMRFDTHPEDRKSTRLNSSH